MIALLNFFVTVLQINFAEVSRPSLAIGITVTDVVFTGILLTLRNWLSVNVIIVIGIKFFCIKPDICWNHFT